MSWFEHAMNPKAITSLYEEVPSLLMVELYRVILNREGSLMTCSFRLPRFPDKPPDKWKKSQFNSAGITLQFIGVEDLKIDGWSINPLVDIKIEKVNSALSVEFSGSGVKIRATCIAYQIDGISGCVDSRLQK